MRLSCASLRLSLIKRIYVGHIHWEIIIKSTMSWANLNGVEVLVIGDTIYARDVFIKTETECSVCGQRFGKFNKGSKLWMGVTNK